MRWAAARQTGRLSGQRAGFARKCLQAAECWRAQTGAALLAATESIYLVEQQQQQQQQRPARWMDGRMADRAAGHSEEERSRFARSWGRARGSRRKVTPSARAASSPAALSPLASAAAGTQALPARPFIPLPIILTCTGHGYDNWPTNGA